MSTKKYINTGKIIENKEDCSDYLFHFTKDSGDLGALDVLCKILSDGKLVRGAGMEYICFTETPVTLLPDLFDYFESFRKQGKSPKFSPYGLAFKKSDLFKKGARPVIYSDYGEEKLLSKEIRWRYQLFHPIDTDPNAPFVDYSWMREWRIRCKSLSFKPRHCFVITKDNAEQYLFQKMDMNTLDGIPDWYRDYKHVSIESIRKTEGRLTIKKLNEIIARQIINEEIHKI